MHGKTRCHLLEVSDNSTTMHRHPIPMFVPPCRRFLLSSSITGYYVQGVCLFRDVRDLLILLFSVLAGAAPRVNGTSAGTLSRPGSLFPGSKFGPFGRQSQSGCSLNPTSDPQKSVCNV